MEAVKVWWEVVNASEDLNDKQLLYDIARVDNELGHTDEAVGLWQKHLEYFPRSLWSAVGLGAAYGALNDTFGRDRAEELVRAMTPALSVGSKASDFVKVRGVDSLPESASAGSVLRVRVYFEFLETISPGETAEVRFSAALGDGVCIPLPSLPKYPGTPPFWRGDCLVQEFALTLPGGLAAGDYHVVLNMGGSRAEVALAPLRVAVAKAAAEAGPS